MGLPHASHLGLSPAFPYHQIPKRCVLRRCTSDPRKGLFTYLRSGQKLKSLSVLSTE